MVGADKGARVFQPAINRGQECPRSNVRPFGGPTRGSAPTRVGQIVSGPAGSKSQIENRKIWGIATKAER